MSSCSCTVSGFSVRSPFFAYLLNPTTTLFTSGHILVNLNPNPTTTLFTSGHILVNNPYSAVNTLPKPARQEDCAMLCYARGYPIAGVEYSNECYCGTAVDTKAIKNETGCSMTCNGAAPEKCGGMFQIGVFIVNCTGSKPPWPPPSPFYPFNNVTLPLEQRLDDIISRLNSEDLIAQLGGPDIGDIDRANLTLPGASYGRECLSGVDSMKIPKNDTGRAHMTHQCDSSL